MPAFDPVEDFFHDVPERVREEAFRQEEQSDTPFGQPGRWTVGPTCQPG